MARDGTVSGGRPKGSVNKRTWEARKIIEDLGFDPLTALVYWAKGDWKSLGYDKATKTVVTSDGQAIEVDRIDEQLRQSSAAELIPYLFPKLKAIELTGSDGEALFGSFAQMVAGLAASPASKKEEEPVQSESADT